MSSATVWFTVNFAISDGEDLQFEAIAGKMAAGSQQEAGTLAYKFFMSADRKRSCLIEAYTDGSAVLAHITGPVVTKLVPELLTVSAITGFSVYGDPGPEAAAILKDLGAELLSPGHGFSR